MLHDFPYPWLVGGGWAIDLALGRITRAHEDVDICVFREYAQELLDYFSEWEIMVAVPGERRLEACRTVEDTSPPRFSLHMRKNDQFIEVFLTDRIGDEVIFRRNSSIRMPIRDFCRADTCGRPFVAPEWQLLFKAKEGRDQDNQDFHVCLPHLTEAQLQWLSRALQRHLPNCPWLAELEG
nr:hypothetical protein [Alicyclobacillus kakegawensis]